MAVLRRYALTTIALLALAAVSSIAYASVFVFYLGNVRIEPVEPPVVIVEGSNANQPDLSGNTIEVTIGQNSSSVQITIHPTYQTTYYHNISEILNSGSNTYYVWIKVDSVSLPAGVNAWLIANYSGTLYELDLTTSGNTIPGVTGIALGPNEKIMLNIKVQISEGITLPPPGSVELSIVYSPQNTLKNITP